MTEVTTLTGTLKRIIFSKDSFRIGYLITKDGEFAILGDIPEAPGSDLQLQGSWVKNATYGLQFSVSSAEIVGARDSGLVTCLSKMSNIKGLGEKRARELVDKYDSVERLEEALMGDLGDINRNTRVPKGVLQELKEKWSRVKGDAVQMTELFDIGLTAHEVKSLAERYPGDGQVVQLLREDPYKTVQRLVGFGFRRADVIAKKLGTPPESESRIRLGLEDVLKRKMSEGHCWEESEQLVHEARELLDLDPDQIEPVLNAEIDQQAGNGGEEAPILCSSEIDGVTAISLHRLYTAEKYLSEVLSGADGTHPHHKRIAPIADRARDLLSGLNDEQKQAYEVALTSAMCLISGGAGSGKTFTVRVIAKALRMAKLEVHFLAPTGKAARRLADVTGEDAQTIHRKLGFGSPMEQYGPRRPFPADVIVIDEVSMLDVELAAKMFQSLDLRRTAVILVGDHNQLPPVGPGNVLRDVVLAKPIPATILTQIVRQAGALRRNCQTVLAHGDVPQTSPPSEGQPRPWYVVAKDRSEEAMVENIQSLYAEHLQDRFGFDLLSDVQLLTPKNKGLLGTDHLNKSIQQVVQRKLYGVECEVTDEARSRILVGDKVIQTRNDYDNDVMNGTLGIVKGIPTRDRMLVEFETGLVTLDRKKGHFNYLQLAYALTVHKTQGSEFPCVIFIAHHSHHYMLHRNLFYTAVTRAKQTALVIGSPKGIYGAASKQQQDKRRTHLRHWCETLRRNHRDILITQA